MKAVILAAGDGIRLRPLSETRPKPLLVVAGKPIIHHLLLEAKKAGVTEAVVIVRHMKEKLIAYLSSVDLGMKIRFIEQGKENGTGAALLCAEKEIQDTFLVLAGDIVTEASVIKSVIDAHTGGISVGLTKVPNPHCYGVAELSNGKISLFEEKAAHPKSDLANMSIYCMEPTVFSELRSIGRSERGEHELVGVLVGAKGVVSEGYWRDIGYPWDLLSANEYLLSKMEARSGNISNSTIDGKVIMESGAKIINSYIEGIAYIGKDTIIGPNATLRGFNSIGANCSIGPGTSVKSSILMDKVNAKHLTYIGDSVVGEDVNFGSGTQIANFRFDGEHVNVMTERGWTNSGRKKLGAVIGDKTKFGVLSCTMPGKLIGSDCWIHSGVVVNRNVPSGSRVFTRQPIEFGKSDAPEE
ncbi:MAG: bifunctional sugar-1-phosphate nucleotidylyltransferase/acetyltransferase [Candidatus Micrarchaeota archaeon]